MTQTGGSRTGRMLLILASFVVVIAGMRAMSAIIVSFLLALFITIVITPMFVGMQQRGLPRWLALLVLILGLVVGTAVGAVVIGKALFDFAKELPGFQAGLQEQVRQLITWLRGKGVEAPERVLMDILNPGAVVVMLGSTVSAMSSLLGSAFVVLLISIFMLLEAAALPAKLRGIPSLTQTMDRLESMADHVRHYMGLKTVISLATGLLAGIWVSMLGMGNGVLLGLLAFILNYIPNIGSIIAAIPAILLALIQFGVGKAIACAIGYLVINVTIGNVIEPRVMGKGFGLSPVMVVLTMVFWAWVLGPVGMLLCVPLTLTVKLALESAEETRWLAVLIGAGPGSPPKAAAPDSAA
jgi:AI-2 transport protein TqsA